MIGTNNFTGRPKSSGSVLENIWGCQLHRAGPACKSCHGRGKKAPKKRGKTGGAQVRRENFSQNLHEEKKEFGFFWKKGGGEKKSITPVGRSLPAEGKKKGKNLPERNVCVNQPAKMKNRVSHKKNRCAKVGHLLEGEGGGGVNHRRRRLIPRPGEGTRGNKFFF